jgi:hypothetical protein
MTCASPFIYQPLRDLGSILRGLGLWSLQG